MDLRNDPFIKKLAKDVTRHDRQFDMLLFRFDQLDQRFDIFEKRMDERFSEIFSMIDNAVLKIVDRHEDELAANSRQLTRINKHLGFD